MNIFDKICASMAFVLGVVLILLGVIGAFIGCKAHFTLPPILGVIPAIIGWGVVKPIILAWKKPPPQKSSVSPDVFSPSGPLRPRPVSEDKDNPLM